MASVRLLLFVTASASAQFVFFGNQHGPPRALGSQPAPAPAREARVLVQPQPVQPRPVQPTQAQPVQPTIQRFQQRPAIILTEEGGVRRTTEAPHMMEIKKMMEMMERE